MDGVDIGLFDFDRHNTLYYFALNAEEQIYLRYGGRTAESPTSHLDLDSLVLALEHGLDRHRHYQDGSFDPPPRPELLFPRQIDSLREKEMGRRRCVECHLIADYQAQDLQLAGRLDKTQTMYASPDLEVLGIQLDVSKGVEVDSAEGAAADAGLEAGDLITAIEGASVLTFGDLQYRYDKLPRSSDRLRLEVEREGDPHEVAIELPPEWWVSDLFFRYWSIEPLLYFSSNRMDEASKTELGLDPDGFACRVRFVERRAAAFGHHQLEVGDILYAVDGVEKNALTTSCELHLKLTNVAGETSGLSLLRGEERVEMLLRSGTQRFRK
jgi:hypothetical protein